MLSASTASFSARRSVPNVLDAMPFRGGATWAMGRSGDVLAMLVVGHFGNEDLLALFRAGSELQHGDLARIVLDLSRLDDGGIRFAVAELTRRQLARLDVGTLPDVAVIAPSGLAGALVLGCLSVGPLPVAATLHTQRDSASCEHTRLVFERLEAHLSGQGSTPSALRKHLREVSP